jgi:gliding motility-associated-like protein
VVTGASGNCDANGDTYTVLVQLAAPIQTGGNYQIHLAPGSDGNTAINSCGLPTPVATLGFTTVDTVSAALFTAQILYGCINDTIEFAYPAKDGVNQWSWIFNGTDTSLLQDPPRKIYPNIGSNTIQLIVSNGTCGDTTNSVVALNNGIKAQFEGPEIICPKDYAQFLNNSTGDISSWNWDFGDGSFSNLKTPPDQLFPPTGIEKKYKVVLTVSNNTGCSDTAAQLVDVLGSCFIAVPSAFTPNGDGVNDFLYPLNAVRAGNLLFRVYNRNGQMVFETNDWTKKWDGTIHGHPEPPGTFVWTLQYTDPDTNKRVFQKGTTIRVR